MTTVKYRYFSTQDPTRKAELTSDRLLDDLKAHAEECGGEYIANKEGTMYAIVNNDGEQIETICVEAIIMEDGIVIPIEETEAYLKTMPVDYSTY